MEDLGRKTIGVGIILFGLAVVIYNGYTLFAVGGGFVWDIVGVMVGFSIIGVGISRLEQSVEDSNPPHA